VDVLSPPTTERPAGAGSRGRRRPPALLVGALVLAVALLAGWIVLDSLRDPPSASGAAGSHTAQRRTADGSAAGAAAAVPRARPAAPARRLTTLVQPAAPSAARLPDGRVVPIRPVSTTFDRTLDVPEDIRTAGWWRGGSRIGDPFGSILVAAHIDSTTQGLGPFADLLSVRPGQQVRVTTRHLRQDFTIRSRTLLPQGSLASHGWLFAATGKPRLTLVTCAPPYIKSEGGYQNLAVVTAVPTTDPVRR
jgi:hypothetical protein